MFIPENLSIKCHLLAESLTLTAAPPRKLKPLDSGTTHGIYTPQEFRHLHLKPQDLRSFKWISELGYGNERYPENGAIADALLHVAWNANIRTATHATIDDIVVQQDPRGYAASVQYTIYHKDAVTPTTHVDPTPGLLRYDPTHLFPDGFRLNYFSANDPITVIHKQPTFRKPNGYMYMLGSGPQVCREQSDPTTIRAQPWVRKLVDQYGLEMISVADALIGMERVCDSRSIHKLRIQAVSVSENPLRKGSFLANVTSIGY
jgi:hypothetical protein